jgi:hypothetical protein
MKALIEGEDYYPDKTGLFVLQKNIFCKEERAAVMPVRTVHPGGDAALPIQIIKMYLSLKEANCYL